MKQVLRSIKSFEDSIGARMDRPPPKSLEIICLWVARLLLALSLAAGIWSLDFTHERAYLTAAMLGVAAIAWGSVEIVTRRVAWEDVRRVRWIGLTLIAGATFGLAIFSLVLSNSERLHLLHGFMYQTIAANLPSDEIRMLSLKHEGGPYITLQGSLWVAHAEDTSTITMNFPSASACRSFLGKHAPPTTKLSRVELGEEIFDGWPRKRMIQEHCGEEVKLVFSRDEGGPR